MERLIPLIIWVVLWAVLRALGGRGKKQPSPVEEKEEEILPSLLEEKSYREEKTVPSPLEERVRPEEESHPAPDRRKVQEPFSRPQEKVSSLPEKEMWRQGIVLREILGPPRAKQRLRH